MNDRSGRPPTLPMRCASFVDRRDELAECASDRLDSDGRPVQLLRLVTGQEGIGKTTFALELAHRTAEHYPDGVLHYECNGSYAEVQVPADEIAHSLLVRLGTPEERIPVAAQDRISTLHRTLYGKRIMVLLDDVATSEQVAPLLFESPAGAVVVTTRNKLTALRRRGFAEVRLGPLPDEDAQALIARIGRAAVAALEPDVLRGVRDICRGWPIALSVVAARLADPDEIAGDYLERLRQRPLEALQSTDDDPVGSVLDVGYRTLPEQSARAYALLSLLPGPHFELGVAAAALGLDEPDAAKLLRDLAERFLLERLPARRFRFHDVIREHAREAARAAFPPAELTAVTAAARWWRCRRTVALDQAITARPVPVGAEQYYTEIDPADADGEPAPWAEFELEWPNLIAALRDSGGPEDANLSVLFPVALWTYGYQTGRCTELIDAYRAALNVATGPGMRWQLHRDLAGLHERLLELDEAERHLVLAAAEDHPEGRQSVHDWLGQIRERRGRLAAAEAEFLRSWDAVPDMPEPQRARAYALLRMHLGRVRRKSGASTEAEADSRAAHEYFTATGERQNRSLSARDLGCALARLGRTAEAVYLLEAACAELTDLGIHEAAAEAADELSTAAELDGRPEAARTWRAQAARLRDGLS